jgi:hypothetical protein
MVWVRLPTYLHSTSLEGKVQEPECMDVCLYDYYRPTLLGSTSCSEKDSLLRPSRVKTQLRHSIVTVSVLVPADAASA